MYRFLITGSSGMIGTGLVQQLLDRGHQVYGLDKRIPEFYDKKILTKFILHDLTTTLDSEKELDNINFNVVIHLAANARVNELVERPELAFENIQMTYNILEWCRKTGNKDFLFASSREVYGNVQEFPVKEYMVTHRLSESPYSTSKLTGESYCYSYARCYYMNPVIMRFSNVYGKYDTSNRFIPLVIKKMLANENFIVNGLEKLLDFTYLDDCLDGILCLLDNWPKLKDVEYNIATGVGSKLFTVAEKVQTLLHSTSKIYIGKSLPGEVVQYVADISKMKKLGYFPKVGIDKGLDRSIEYYKKLYAT